MEPLTILSLDSFSFKGYYIYPKDKSERGRGWLKMFGQFWCSGGVLVCDFSRLVQTWCRGGSGLFFGHRLAGAQKPKTGVGNPFFRVKNSFFWGKHGAEISFFGVKISFFGAQKC